MILQLPRLKNNLFFDGIFGYYKNHQKHSLKQLLTALLLNLGN
jgi:hypothetical protein